MGATKKNLTTVRNMLNYYRKRNGVSSWRFVFSGIENSSGQERKFFIELSMVNPSLSPSEAVLGFKPRAKVNAEDLQNVLAGTVSAQKLESESLEVPSYVCISVGMLGNAAKSIKTYTTVKNLKINSRIIEATLENCFFSEDKLVGKLECTPAQLQEHPEYLCDSGRASWDIQYEIKKETKACYKSKMCTWNPTGLKTLFAGTLNFDGKVYNIIPKRSFGYIDCYSGKDFLYPSFHLSSSNFTSLITGKTLQDSSFAVQGLFNDRFTVVVQIEGNSISFEAHKSRHSYDCHWELNQINESDSPQKLHWTVTAHNRKYVIDIDVYSIAGQMYVRSVELAEGGRNTLKVLSDGEGLGEIRIYKRIRRNLELIEHAKIAGTFCEFGQKEEFNK